MDLEEQLIEFSTSTFVNRCSELDIQQKSAHMKRIILTDYVQKTAIEYNNPIQTEFIRIQEK